MATSVNVNPKVHIGKVIQNAIVFNFGKLTERTVNTDSLIQHVARLFAILKEQNIDYLLVGGIALLQYVEGRNTEDIDLIMAVNSLKKVSEIDVTSQDMNFARGQFGELQIDVLFTRNQLFEKVHNHYATTRPFIEQTIPCATVEGLLLLKMYALPSLYHQGNFARASLYENDIATLIYSYKPQIEPLLEELAQHHSKTDMVAIREIVSEVEQRITRFGKGFSFTE